MWGRNSDGLNEEGWGLGGGERRTYFGVGRVAESTINDGEFWQSNTELTAVYRLETSLCAKLRSISQSFHSWPTSHACIKDIILFAFLFLFLFYFLLLFVNLYMSRFHTNLFNIKITKEGKNHFNKGLMHVFFY